MMKFGIILAGVSAVLAVQAQAATFTCKEPADFAKTNYNDWADAKVTLEIDRADEITLKVRWANRKTDTVVAQLDRRFKSVRELRFIDDKLNIGSSDNGETGIFVSKSLMKGRSGTVKITSNQANDGESGNAYIWGTDALLRCE